MSTLYSNGILTVNAIPTHTPQGEQAKLARLVDSFTYYFWNGANWQTMNLDFLGPYNEGIITNSTSIHQMLQELESAIGNLVSADGNLHTIVRITDTAPTPGAVAPTYPGEIEVGELVVGDAAIIYYKKTNGTNWGFYDRWVYKNVNGTPTWVYIITIDFSDYVSEVTVTRLADKNTLTPHTNVGGSDVPGDVTELLPASGTEAGLMTPTQFSDLADLVANAITGVADTNTIDLAVTAGVNILTAMLKIDNASGTNVFTLSSDTNGVYISSSTLPTYASHSAASADSNLAIGDYYCLSITNIEGVPSNGTGPLFRKA